MFRIRMLVAIALLTPFAGAQPADGQKIRFAQLTDPHIFDSAGKPGRDSQPENERVFRWVIDEINRRNAIGPAYEFVVLTGDIGLEKIKDDKASIDGAASEFKEFVDRSDVRQWIIVPGNNDLLDERPASVTHFHSFVTALSAAVGNRKTIRDFAPLNGKVDLATLAIGNCLFVGFDDASFKSNNDVDQAKTTEFHDEQIMCLTRPGEEIALNDNKTNEPYLYVYILCHIPNIDDPYLASMDADERRKRAKPNEKKKFGEDARFPASAWTVIDDDNDGEIRPKWTKILSEPRVQRVCAGHFHTDDRRWYHALSWAKKLKLRLADKYQYPPVSFDKLLVCPPIAVKNQMTASEEARGFRDVTIDGDTGNVSSEIVWADGAKELLYQVENPSQGCPRLHLPPTRRSMYAYLYWSVACWLDC